ncbi:MAG: (d)CMP kinase [Opitutaceae bacterium]|nr:(d)CMP kinase [Opitutaceae bacterium]
MTDPYNPLASSQKFIIVAIDGGAASGKSSTSRGLSERFNFLHVDTGSFYRAVTYQLRQAGENPAEAASIAQALKTFKLGTLITGRDAMIKINDWVPGDEIRSQEINESVSLFAAVPAVRGFLLDYQRDQATVARENSFDGLIMEGRDIGSIIFPDADHRFFLQADLEARAQRRISEGQNDKIAERDRLDSTRKISPLVCPAGATLIDSTYLSLDEVVDLIAKKIQAD